MSKNEVGEAKLCERLNATKAVIETALRAAGVEIDDGPQREPTNRKVRLISAKGAIVRLEAGKRPGFATYHNTTGDEPLVVQVGPHNRVVKIHSAKEDPNLTGKRLPRIVEEVLRDLVLSAKEKQARKDKYTNEEASFQIADRCNKLAGSSLSKARFGATEMRADRVVFSVRDTLLTEDEAKAVIAALAPILAKVARRNEAETDLLCAELERHM